MDTNLVIDHFRKKTKTSTPLYRIIKAHDVVCLSSVSQYELLSGANALQLPTIQPIIEPFEVLPFDAACSIKASDIFRQLKAVNHLVEFRDIFIAATAIVNDLPLATLNRKHFEHISGLNLYPL